VDFVEFGLARWVAHGCVRWTVGCLLSMLVFASWHAKCVFHLSFAVMPVRLVSIVVKNAADKEASFLLLPSRNGLRQCSLVGRLLQLCECVTKKVSRK
jgi:hypothetical protein